MLSNNHLQIPREVKGIGAFIGREVQSAVNTVGRERKLSARVMKTPHFSNTPIVVSKLDSSGHKETARVTVAEYNDSLENVKTGRGLIDPEYRGENVIESE